MDDDTITQDTNTRTQDDTNRATIGIAKLLAVVDRDVETLQGKKGFYAVQLWWQLERERLAAQYGAIDCSAPVTPARRKWKRPIALPGRWFDLALVAVCITLGFLALLR